jgi:hypothetical protein
VLTTLDLDHLVSQLDVSRSHVVCIPLVDLKIEDPCTHSPSTWVRCTVSQTM